MLICPHCQEKIKFTSGISNCPNCSEIIEIKSLKVENQTPLLFEDVGQKSFSAGDREISIWSGKIFLAIMGALGGTVGSLLGKTIPLKTILGLVALVGFIFLLREIFRIAFKPLDKKLEKFAEEKELKNILSQ